MYKRMRLDKAFILLVNTSFLIFSFIKFYDINNSFELSLFDSKIIFIFIIWCVVSSLYVEKDIFSPNFLFLLFTIFFNCSSIILHSCGYEEIFSEYILVPYNYIYKAMWLTCIGMNILHITSTLSRVNKQKIVTKSKENYEILGYIGLILIGISIIPYIKDTINTINVISKSTYINAYFVEKSSLSTFLLPGIIFLLAASKKKKYYKIISFLLLFIYIVPLLYIGRRGQAFIGLVSFFFLYDRGIKKVPRINILLTGIFLFFFIFPALAIFRQLSDKSLNDFLQIIQQNEGTLYDMLYEGGITFMSTAYVLYLVPIKGFHYGLDYIFAILSTIPNLVYQFDYFNEVGNPGLWVTKLIAPNIYEIGGGLGFNYIAEAYLNFSIIGVLLIPLIFTLILRKLDNNTLIKNISLSIFIGLIPSFSRGSIYDIVRPSIWYIVIPLIIYYFLSEYKEKILNNKIMG